MAVSQIMNKRYNLSNVILHLKSICAHDILFVLIYKELELLRHQAEIYTLVLLELRYLIIYLRKKITVSLF